ncbi:MPV17 mitochondrial inner membrane protein like [Homo sapiens]|uniref:Isoform 2 of Mpv17-like protein n=1 Tax=Homo sapiens TaxID=9606 RepID=Q2QL34-2|nr:mpv17-like protein isoform 2 [Homo sapiens]AAH61514.1 MPV17 mitochondrial membrane protein-like [Homo sapiens]AAY58893.1 Mpv17-like protein type 2 [Homo sapiens]EAW53915.1 Mpv17-like protein type 2, isoform CRA_b [Homo sapiens]KAI2577305.1 MPV17 mitochondrial inner membrane protein like [Homo sapiens]KAI4053708.1 MPV17 mitochondrial inner membrane protein like [Homo sapiens]|eukprot:NP_776164.2 mpv17-like protein isoform 2 [Homo sapiens]
MAGWWPALSRAARRHPWPTNVLLYGSLVSAGDALQQRLQGREANWRQTRRVATLVVTFHANFNYVWLRLLERALPGRAPHALLAKLLCDQVVGAPIAVSAFYVEWTDVLALCTADQLQPCSCSMENSLRWSLWFSLGHLHLFFPAEW